jgi:antitoxin component YwqK of YwqJK toxin-antitoxin module
MEKIIKNKVKLIKIGLDYYQLLEILKYTECGNQFRVITRNKKIDWYENGQLDTRYTNGDKLNELYESWYSDGQFCERINYTEGSKKNGLYESWYSNGQICERTNYVENETCGLYELWYSNGHICARMNYTEGGKKNGLSELWYDNGQLHTRMHYIEDEIYEILSSDYI